MTNWKKNIYHLSNSEVESLEFEYERHSKKNIKGHFEMGKNCHRFSAKCEMNRPMVIRSEGPRNPGRQKREFIRDTSIGNMSEAAVTIWRHRNQTNHLFDAILLNACEWWMVFARLDILSTYSYVYVCNTIVEQMVALTNPKQCIIQLSSRMLTFRFDTESCLHRCINEHKSKTRTSYYFLLSLYQPYYWTFPFTYRNWKYKRWGKFKHLLGFFLDFPASKS